MITTLFTKLARTLPGSIREKIEQEIVYAGIAVESQAFVGFMIFYSLLIAFFAALTLQLFYGFNLILVFIGLAVLILLTNYLSLYLIAENKAKFVEKILPDALQLFASNLKAGMTTEKALIVSARKEFGPLADEFKKASKKMLSGTRNEIALMGIGSNIRSKQLQFVMQLMVEGLKAGGEMADLLIELSSSLREETSVENEVRANISLYMVMILFVAMIGGPALLGIATVVVEVITNNLGQFPAAGPTGITSAIQTSETQDVSFEQTIAISNGFVVFFSSLLLILTAIFSSLALGIINDGNEKNGLKFIPLILIVSWIVFYLARIFFQGFFTLTI